MFVWPRMLWEFVRLMTRKSSAAQRNYTNRLKFSHSRLLETQLNQERDRINMRRLTAGLVIFALVVKVGSEALTDLFTSTGCNSVSGPASILREIKNLIPYEKRCPLSRNADPVLDTRTISIEPGWLSIRIKTCRRNDSDLTGSTFHA